LHFPYGKCRLLVIQDEQHTSALVAAGAKKANILSLACVRGIGFDPLSFTARAVPITIDLPPL
jgi:hypothetical protein